jgi:aminoglycoside phosphotransferase (APT) family kinase protein
MDNLIAWLPKNIPATDETTVVHGDYRLDNTVFHPTEPRLLAVLDWELSTLGDPLADFSYHCMSWQIPSTMFRGLGGLPHAELGIPTEGEYVERYFKRTGRKRVAPSVWDYYMAYNMFRLAAICQGIAKRIVDGTAASEHAREAGARARPLGELGWAQVEKILKRST